VASRGSSFYLHFLPSSSRPAFCRSSGVMVGRNSTSALKRRKNGSAVASALQGFRRGRRPSLADYVRGPAATGRAPIRRSVLVLSTLRAWPLRRDPRGAFLQLAPRQARRPPAGGGGASATPRRAAPPRSGAFGAGPRAGVLLRRGHRAALRSALPPVVPVTTPVTRARVGHLAWSECRTTSPARRRS
jgi:hypothetical protein